MHCIPFIIFASAQYAAIKYQSPEPSEFVQYHDTIPISWEPVTKEFAHGSLVEYRVTYQAVTISDLQVEFEPAMSEDIRHAATSMTLENLEPLVGYRITVSCQTRGLDRRGLIIFGG